MVISLCVFQKLYNIFISEKNVCFQQQAYVAGTCDERLVAVCLPTSGITEAERPPTTASTLFPAGAVQGASCVLFVSLFKIRHFSTWLISILSLTVSSIYLEHILIIIQLYNINKYKYNYTIHKQFNCNEHFFNVMDCAALLCIISNKTHHKMWNENLPCTSKIEIVNNSHKWSNVTSNKYESSHISVHPHSTWEKPHLFIHPQWFTLLFQITMSGTMIVMQQMRSKQTLEFEN